MSGKDNTTEGTTPNTHQVSEPHITYSRTWHTVGGTLQEVSSSEATNTFEPTFWPSNPYDRKPKQVYVYETVEETSWDEGKTPNSEGTSTGNDCMCTVPSQHITSQQPRVCIVHVYS
ncbi:hypothetical protein Pmani_010412 [Petrolisthes manimaculis]|uniref:Uncharacterized protein n=1 Tax=Petrolisthes manimaculis TaxID=1843537 RepID=A0AAE1UFL8_9EUCA|nr:hypothetical protein Pmani_010412 [Petrolisthes manimaculis]